MEPPFQREGCDGSRLCNWRRDAVAEPQSELAAEHEGVSDQIDMSTRILKFVIPLSAVALFVGGWILALRKRNS